MTHEGNEALVVKRIELLRCSRCFTLKRLNRKLWFIAVDLTGADSYGWARVHAVDTVLHNHAVFHCHVTISLFPHK